MQKYLLKHASSIFIGTMDCFRQFKWHTERPRVKLAFKWWHHQWILMPEWCLGTEFNIGQIMLFHIASIYKKIRRRFPEPRLKTPTPLSEQCFNILQHSCPCYFSKNIFFITLQPERYSSTLCLNLFPSSLSGSSAKGVFGINRSSCGHCLGMLHPGFATNARR